MEKTKKLVIVGAGEFAGIALEYFTFDSEYEVVAFAVDEQYKASDEYMGLPLISFHDLREQYPPDDYHVFAAIAYSKLNRDRRRVFKACKELGYTCASYISSHAFVWHNVSVGENTFIFEDNTVQYHVSIGNNVVLWSGNHIGHRTVIEDDVWLTSHCVVSGFCRIGRGSFIGVNATLGDYVTLGEDTVFGAGALTVKNLKEKGCVYVGSPAKKLNRTAYEQFGVEVNEQ